jgi:hypothetical protein
MSRQTLRSHLRNHLPARAPRATAVSPRAEGTREPRHWIDPTSAGSRFFHVQGTQHNQRSPSQALRGSLRQRAIQIVAPGSSASREPKAEPSRRGHFTRTGIMATKPKFQCGISDRPNGLHRPEGKQQHRPPKNASADPARKLIMTLMVMVDSSDGWGDEFRLS